ncbi:MAG TPA: patatin-like phospholipase family protein [Terriglobia bacterium]|nr:patatin-like phospholipase family protein [Terriglobia bacterium]
MATNLTDKLADALRSGIRGLRAFAYAPPRRERATPSVVTRPRIGLALGGGFARGMAHIGVLKVLVENGIPIDALSGASVGSIIAAVFAAGAKPDEMTDYARRVRWRSFARWTVARLGLASNWKMDAMLREFLHGTTFEELKKPLAVVATDISSGETVVFREGELLAPLRASCSFPGLFTPVSYQGRLLVDGAIVGSVPAGALRGMGVDRIIGVHLNSNGPHHIPTNIFQVVGQAFQIAERQSSKTWRQDCDAVIEPDVSEFNWDDFDRVDEMVAAGERAAREALPMVRRLLEPVEWRARAESPGKDWVVEKDPVKA